MEKCFSKNKRRSSRLKENSWAKGLDLKFSDYH